ncbi:uncharacterized protein HRG_11895 [Hirsutella rhossiliensis]|uniref:Uncharacterized protein n=1 Tax=Hirsutella rhossiliensis TaxID=111463 RepID=A0A9P8MPU9_9HYPO|nr:uncharacterized protein HRG_11895 [Hirsutella rhossiliensis]KAH0957027.1 hypothetical protein HRG_11895 [Hirsutella rhossiliensis]
MSSSSPLPPPHLRKPLDSQKGAGGDMSMMFFVQPDCPRDFPIRTSIALEVSTPRPLPASFATSFMVAHRGICAAPIGYRRLADIHLLQSQSLFTTSLLSPPNGLRNGFYERPRPPYALAWEVKQRDGLESETGDTLIYTMPALVVRDQGYQPILPRLFASMDNFPCIPPIVSFTGFILGPGHSLLRQDLLPDLDAAQLNCCGFVQLSTYLAPGIPDKIPFRGFHQFEKMAERKDSYFQPSIPFTCTGKVAGLLSHRVMIHPPGSDRDYVFIVVPDSWTFLDKATSTAAASSSAISTPLKEKPSSASAAFRDILAASYSVATPETAPDDPETFVFYRYWGLCYPILLPLSGFPY